MLRIIQEKLGIKLFILFTAVIVMAVVPLTYSALQVLRSYGDQALHIHGEQIRSQTLDSLQELTREKAAHTQERFDRIAASAAMLGSQATAIYNNLQLYGERPLYDDALTPSLVTGNFINDLALPVLRAYWGGSAITPEIRLELRALTHMAPLFARVLRENPDVIASHSISISGVGQYYTTKKDYKQAAAEIPPSSVFDLRDGEPVTIFTRSEEKIRDVRWTDIYKDDVIEGFMLTASAPIYDDDDHLCGITGIDVPLTTVLDEMLTSSSKQGGLHLLFSFLLGEDSRVIAFPEKYYPLFGLEPAASEYRYSSDRLTLYLSDSQYDNFKRLAASATGSDELQQKIMLNGDNYYVVTSKMPKQGWVFGVVVRESDMLNIIEEGRRELDQTIGKMAAKSIIFALLTIGIATVIIFLLLKHLITPLRKLSQATEQVAAGNFEVHCPVTTKDEAGLLATSFNSMVMQLHTAQKQQHEYSAYLEKEVAAQNAQVTRQKLDLERNVVRLQDEIKHRHAVSEKLREQSEELNTSLQEKEMLLREIHHRIKNNMLIVISMLELQRQEMEGERQRQIFKEMENRIRSMALVHEKLYSSNSISRIDIAAYLHDVAKSLLSSMVIDDRITLDLQAEPISIDIDHAIPVGLVINEIITNAIKHAFPGGRQGKISVAVKRTCDNQIELTVADDGIGIAKGVDILQSSSFGTGIIIGALVKMQLKGKIKVEQEQGTKYTISFLDPLLHKRL